LPTLQPHGQGLQEFGGTTKSTRFWHPDLTHINVPPWGLDINVGRSYPQLSEGCRIMSNVGSADRIARIVVGVLLIAYAIPIGFPQTGWNWVGWIGVVPVLTAIFAYCPASAVFGMSTCPAKQQG
jgi:hypothetical protein